MNWNHERSMRFFSAINGSMSSRPPCVSVHCPEFQIWLLFFWTNWTAVFVPIAPDSWDSLEKKSTAKVIHAPVVQVEKSRNVEHLLGFMWLSFTKMNQTGKTQIKVSLFTYILWKDEKRSVSVILSACITEKFFTSEQAKEVSWICGAEAEQTSVAVITFLKRLDLFGFGQ